MKTRYLALRVALNSAVLIFIVYLLMQTAVFFRDSVLLGTTAMHDFFPSVFGFIGTVVVPPMILFGILLWLAALPIQRTGLRLEKGEILDDTAVEKVRKRIISFKYIVLAINLLGFLAGFILDLILGNKMHELAQLHRQIILVSNCTAAFVLSAAQTSLNNVAFAPVRDRLKITAIGIRSREASSTLRQIRLTAALVLYASVVVQYNQRDLTTFQTWGEEVLAEVAAGTIPEERATEHWRSVVKDRLHIISTRDPAIIDTLTPPWESRIACPARQQGIFLVIAGLMLLITVTIQIAVSAEQRDWLNSLRDRLKDVVAGGGDLRQRLALRSMDDLGEIAEMINRLLDQFQTIVQRIGSAAEQSRSEARAVDTMLTQAEEVSRQVGDAVIALKKELEQQAENSRVLTLAVQAVREATAAADREALHQNNLVLETSQAMQEMAGSIETVREQSRDAESITKNLSGKGESGGEAVRETRIAIASIQKSSAQIMQHLGALNKIAADTNLLAMNAAIEAAHAGEKGAGFAVVADEVRNLAGIAADQTKSIKSLIQEMARQVAAGVEKADISGTVINDLIGGLNNSAEVSRTVAKSMESQAAGTRTIAGSLNQVVQSSSAIRERMQTQSSTTEQIGREIEDTLARLASLVETSNRQVQAASSLEKSFADVRHEVDNNATAIENLQKEIGRFTI